MLEIANTANLFMLFLVISVFLYAAQVQDTSGKLFSEDILTKWVKINSDKEVTGSMSDDLTSSTTEITNYGADGVSSGTSFFNFWDVVQIFWSIVKLLINIFLIIPISLIQLAIPLFMKWFLVIVFIFSLGVFALSMMGKR